MKQRLAAPPNEENLVEVGKKTKKYTPPNNEN